MKVRAIAFGFYRQKRRIGDVFDFEGKPSEKWMEPVDEAAKTAFKKAGLKVAPSMPAKAGGAPAKNAAGDVLLDPASKSTGDQNVI